MPDDQNQGVRVALQPSTKQPNLGKFPKFANRFEQSCAWETYKEDLNLQLRFLNIKDQRRMRDVTLIVGGPVLKMTYKHSTHILPADMGENPTEEQREDRAYDILILTLDAALKPKSCNMYFRNRFQKMQQKQNESVSDFLLRLYEQSVFCNFGANEEERVFEQLVSGTLNEELRTRCFQEGYDLHQYILYASQYENAHMQNKQLKSSSSNNVQKQHKQKNSSSSSSQPTLCYRCGENRGKTPQKDHEQKGCKGMGSTCGFCSKENHLEKVCLQKKKKQGGGDGGKKKFNKFKKKSSSNTVQNDGTATAASTSSSSSSSPDPAQPITSSQISALAML